MTDDLIGEGVSRFLTLRRTWFEQLAGSLARLLGELSPAVAGAVPGDLGDRDVVAAVVLARVAQADTECREIAFVAGDLVRLAGDRGVHAPERIQEVEELWTALREPAVPLLRSWWREPLAEGFLSHWAEVRANRVGWDKVHQELRERWSLDSDDIWRRGLMSHEDPRNLQWRGYFEHLEVAASAHAADYARAVATRWTDLAAEIEACMSEKADELAAVPHLDLVHKERVLAEAVTTVVELNLEAGADELPDGLRAVMGAIVDSGKTYLDWLNEGFIPALTPLERAHLSLGTAEAARGEAYLRQYADVWCSPAVGTLPTPVFTEEDFTPLKPAERPRAVAPDWMGMVAQVFGEGTQRGWVGAVGSQPWWLYTVEGGLESAAALRFKHDGRVRIGHRTADDPHDMLVGLPPDEPDAHNLVMRFRYDDEDPRDMCELLALARAGRTKLGFLVRGSGGECRVLRVVSVPVPPALREAMRRKAVGALDELSGNNPQRLARLIAPEGDEPAGETADSVTTEPPHEWEESLDGGLFPRGDTLF